MDTKIFDDMEEVSLVMVRGEFVRTVPEAGSLSIRTVEAISDAGWELHLGYRDNYFTWGMS